MPDSKNELSKEPKVNHYEADAIVQGRNVREVWQGDKAKYEVRTHETCSEAEQFKAGLAMMAIEERLEGLQKAGRKEAEMAGGTKYDDRKLKWHLLPLELLEGAVRVLMHGAEKYDEWNWTQGIKFSRLINATLRHMTEIQGGYDYDPESQLLHADHAIVNLIFLRYQLKNAYSHTSDNKALYRDFDDRTRVGRPIKTFFEGEDSEDA